MPDRRWRLSEPGGIMRRDTHYSSTVVSEEEGFTEELEEEEEEGREETPCALRSGDRLH